MAVNQLAHLAWWVVTGEGKRWGGWGFLDGQDFALGSGIDRIGCFDHTSNIGIDLMPHPCGDSLAMPFPSDEMPKLTSWHPFIPALSLQWHHFAVSFPNVIKFCNVFSCLSLWGPYKLFHYFLFLGLRQLRSRLFPPNKSSLCVIIFKWQNILKLIRLLEGSFSEIVNCKTLKFIWSIPNMASLWCINLN